MLAPLFNKITSIKFICGADKKSIYVGVVKMDPSSLMCMLNKIGNDILDFKTSCLGDVACPNILRSCLLNIGGNNG